MSIDRLITLREEVENCTKCRLHKVRINPVFGEGNINSPLIAFLGEYPNQNDDLAGSPFVYSPLEKWLEYLGLKREEVYLLHTVACHPNRKKPFQDERYHCKPYFIKQLEIVKPKTIIVLGLDAAYSLLNLPNNTHTHSMTILRSKWWKWQDIPVRVTYNPNGSKREHHKAMDDLNLVKRYLLINKL